MGFRELTMVDVRELLRRYQAGESTRRTARECGADRKTVKRYYEAAEQCGVRVGVELTDAVVGEVARRIQARPAPAPSDAWKALVPVRDRIEAWLQAERPLRLVRIRELLAREGIAVSYSTLRRYAQREFGFGGPRVTVRLADAAHRHLRSLLSVSSHKGPAEAEIPSLMGPPSRQAHGTTSRGEAALNVQGHGARRCSGSWDHPVSLAA